MRPLPRIARRWEAAILPPISLFVLIGLSTFTLFAYRTAVHRLVEERRAEVTQRAASLATSVLESTADTARLQRLLSTEPDARALAILGEDGLAISEAGDLLETNVLAMTAEMRGNRAIGPDRETGDRIIGLARLPEGRIFRLDIQATTLANQTRSLPMLTTVVLGVNGALMLLFLLFLRHWMAPFETLAERARELSGSASGDGHAGDIEHLLATFERAVAIMAEAKQQGTATGQAISLEADIEALQRTLSPSLESGLLLLGRDGKVLALNPIGQDLLGTKADLRSSDRRPARGIEEMEVEPPSAGDSRLHFCQLIGHHEAFCQVLESCIESGQGAQRKECEIDRAGVLLPLGLTVHPLKPQGGSIGGWLVLFADLTAARKEAKEQQLSKSLGQIGELTAGLAHELRNSLASVRGYLTLIERQPSDEAVPDYLLEIRTEADHLQRVLEDFLTFARPGSTRVERMRLETLIRRAVADPALALLDVEVDLVVGDEDLELQGDRQLLERAFRNLVHNAARAQKESRCEDPVEVHLSRSTSDSGTAEVRILDRGPGISDAIAERLFVPFATGRSDGVGLGLALSLRIFDLHDGQLQLTNRPDGGAAAKVSLPVTSVTSGNSS